MKSFLQRIFKLHIIRYGIVGGIGIPINDLALYLFLHLMGNSLYPLASALAFEISTTINFFLNQIFTYREQKLHGWDWIRRAGKAQLTSLSALLISYIAALVLVYVFHTSYYLANPAGIIIAFVYNYFISRKLVFRATTAPNAPEPLAQEKNDGAISELNLHTAENRVNT
jgi:putative flippase GtrA